MTYTIKYSYRTGDSFGSEDMIGWLELTWENKAAAQEALKCIKEHYEYKEKMEGYHWNSQIYKKSIKEKAKSKPWFVSDKAEGIMDHWYSSNCLKIKTDEGRDFQFHAPWCGYFELLYSASVVEVEDPADSISF